MSKVMKKNLLLLFNRVNYIELKHTIRIMKITTVLTLIAIFQLSATSLHSQNAKVSISKNNLPLREFIHEIEKQTDYLFMYSEKEIDLQERVNVSAKNKPVSKVLQEVFENSGIVYNFNEGYISLSTKSNAVNQIKKVTGLVKDASGEPVIGANVMVKGTTNGSVTDIDGQFSLEVPQNATLVVSYIGYLPQEIVIGNKTTFTISLREDTQALDEVVVIGYGTTSTRKMASAVTAVKGEKLQDLPFNDMTSTLQGRATGVIVQNQGGEPGSNAKISIRGGNDPVYVIDGVISTAWEFNTLNPVDIESLSVLKDAASLAVYGSRAADGIILVKTKQGNKGKTAITYTFNAEFDQPTIMREKIDGYTYAVTQNKAAMYDGLPDFHQYSEEELNKILNQTDPLYPDVDWIDLGFKNFSPQYRHTLSMNGSGKLVNYYLSLGMIDQGSLFTSNALDYNRYTIRSNVNTTFDKIGLTVGFNINGALEKKNSPYVNAGTIWGHLYNILPLTPAFNEDGTYSSATDHPLVDMDKRSGYNKNTKKYINTQFVADWALPWVQGLSLGTMFNYRVSDEFKKEFNTRAPQFYPTGADYPIAKPTLKESADFKESYNFEVSASYMNTFNEDHSIDAKAVFTVAENNGNNFWTSRKDYMSSAVDQIFAGSPAGILNDGSGEEGGRMGIVGRVKYDYKNRYIIEGSFRYDGSDNFAPGYRWGFFPSGAVAWALSEEPFFKSLNWKDVDLIKLRASYGQTGTENGVNRFGYMPVYDMDKNIIVIGGELQSGFSEGKLVSPSLLSWYTRNSLNYGIDMAFLGNRLKSTADYFFYVTKGGLMSPGDRYTTPLGKDLPQIKSNSEQRREGVEFSLRWNDKAGKDFTYDLGFNMTYFNNLWKVKADESIANLINPWKRTTNQTDFYDVRLISQGYYQTVEQILNSPRRPQASELKFGDIAYQDINGDGKIDDQDQKRVGNASMPHFTYGFDFSFGYKGFSLSGLLYGTGKRNMEVAGQFRNVRPTYKQQLDYWTEENRDATFPRLTTATSRNGDNNIQKSDFWLKNAAFLRLKNLQISYDLKYSVLKNVDWLNTCRINLSGANLFTISGMNKFYDPESPNIDNNGNIYATDGSAYPVQRVISFGLTVGF